MSNIKDSISAVFIYENEIFIIERQNYLKAFPGYSAFPGGKIDSDDSSHEVKDVFKKYNYETSHINALEREISEELNINLYELYIQKKVDKIHLLGEAISPAFNPYRFSNYYYAIHLNEKINIIADEDEAKKSYWITPQKLHEKYLKGEILAVPPMIYIMSHLGEDPKRLDYLDLNFTYDVDQTVPMIENISGIKQFMPLSNTLPPANRTNCFHVGDILVDPSPKNLEELDKLYNSIDGLDIKQVFITHHHPDHYQYSVELSQKLNVSIGISRDTYKRICKKEGDDYFGNTVIQFFKEGDVLTYWKEKPVYIYEVPGHDEGQLAFAPKSMEWFVVGDLIQGMGTVVISEPEGDMFKYFNSLKKVIKLNPKIILPSHGIPMGGVFRLEKTLEHRQKREDQIKELQSKGLTVEEMLPIIYKGTPQKLWSLAKENIKAHLKKINM